MKNTKKRRLYSGILAGFVLAIVSQAALAGDASVSIYWTRGYDGTGTMEATNTNKVFLEDGGTVFSDRLIQAANTIADVDKLGVVNPTTGAREDTSITADYSNDGSLYLHIGYINSGFTGAGNTIEDMVLNGDLVLGRLLVEETYTRDGETLVTPNIPLKVTSGDSDYKLIFNYTGGNNMLASRSASFFASSPIQFDCDIQFDAIGSIAGVINSQQDMTFGSSDHKRTILVDATTAAASSTSTVFMCVAAKSSITVYSDIIFKRGVTNVLFKNENLLNVYGDVTFDPTTSFNGFNFYTTNGAGAVANFTGDIDYRIDTNTTSYPNLFNVDHDNSSLTVGGNITINDVTGFEFKGLRMTKASAKANFDGTITINDASTSNFFLFYATGGTLVSTGDIIVNNFSTGSKGQFELTRIDGDNESFTFKGDTYIKSTVTNDSVGYGYRIFSGSNSSLTVEGDIIVDGAYNGHLFSIGAGVKNATVDVYGNIQINGDMAKLYLFYNNSTTSVVNFYGDITFGVGVSQSFNNDTLFGGSRANGSVVNYYGKIDTSAGPYQAGFASGASGNIVNFRGSQDNVFCKMGLRGGAYNLLNTSGAAISFDSLGGDQTEMGLGGGAYVNIFGDGQVKSLFNTRLVTFAPSSDGRSGTINMNGVSTFYVGEMYFGTAGRRLVVDFGMTENGMTQDQMSAQGITSEMVNATGAGVSQDFVIGNVLAVKDSLNYVLIKNYVVGEDRIISYTSLYDAELLSKTVLEDNVLRIDGYLDSELYGVEYWLEEYEIEYDGGFAFEYVMVPEPSTFVAIFGAVALGVVVIRRRK